MDLHHLAMTGFWEVGQLCGTSDCSDFLARRQCLRSNLVFERIRLYNACRQDDQWKWHVPTDREWIGR